MKFTVTGRGHSFTGLRKQSCLFGIVLVVVLCSRAVAADKPNIIFFLADDQRNDVLGCSGNPIVKTPTLDGLAAEGVRFENAFCEVPICAASRSTLFSGLSQRTHGYNFGEPNIPAEYIDTSYPMVLKSAGYRIGFAGKYGMKFAGPGLQKQFDYFKSIGRNPYLKKMADGSLRHETDLCGDAAIEFIKANPVDKPFCLSISFNATHAEDGDRRPGVHFQWPESTDGMYEDVEMPAPKLAYEKYFKSLPPFLQDKKKLNRQRYFWRWDTPEKYQTNMRAYFRMLTGIDNAIARVLKELKAKGLDKNTIIVYSADNGYMMGDRGIAGKWNHYDQSLSIPLIIYNPFLPEAQRGRVVKELVSNIDMAPTFVDLAGLEVPKVYQGYSLVPLVEGKEVSGWRKEVFCEHKFKQFNNWHGVRGERYKYALYYDEPGGAYECLYDMERDSTEFVNLAANPEYSSVLSKMKTRLDKYLDAYPKVKASAAKKADSENKRPVSAVGKSNDISASAKPYVFNGREFVRLGDTPALTLENSLKWEMEVEISDKALPGSVLMGNRETPGRKTTFFKITPAKGVQLFKNGKQLVCIKVKFPRNKWIKIAVVKTGNKITVSCDGKEMGSAVLNEGAPAMPCYLGGDPKSGEFSHGEIRMAKVEC